MSGFSVMYAFAKVKFAFSVDLEYTASAQREKEPQEARILD